MARPFARTWIGNVDTLPAANFNQVYSALNGLALVLDGVTYAQTAAGLQTALTDCLNNGGGEVYVPGGLGTITVSTPITIGAGVKLRCGPNTMFQAVAGASSVAMFYLIGTAPGTPQNLTTADLVEGQNYALVATGGITTLGLSVGDIVTVTSTDVNLGQFVSRVATLTPGNPDTIYLTEPVPDGGVFTLAKTAQIAKVACLDAVEIDGLWLDATGNSGAATYGIQSLYTSNLKISNLKATNFAQSGLYLQGANYAPQIENVEAINCGSGTVSAIELDNCYSYRYRKLYAHNCSSFAIQTNTSAWGIASELHASHCTGRGIKVQNDRHSQFIGCKANGSTGSTGFVVTCLSHDLDFTDCEAIGNYESGFSMGPTTGGVTAQGYNIVITGGRFLINALGGGTEKDIFYSATIGAGNVISAETEYSTFTDNSTTVKVGVKTLPATAPAANLLGVIGIANGDTAYAQKAIFDATIPGALTENSAGAAGTQLTAAHRDHTHPTPVTYAPTAHGASAHTDITRKVVWTAMEFEQAFGTTAAKTQVGSDSATTYNTVWSLPTAADTGLSIFFTMPADWDGTTAPTFKIWYSKSAADAATWVVILDNTTFLGDGSELIDKAITTSTSTIVTPAAATAKRVDVTAAITVTVGANLNRLLLYRFTASANDTNSGAIYILAVEMTYMANQ